MLKLGKASLHRYPVGQKCGFQKVLVYQYFWRVKYMLKLGKASLHRYPVGQKCGFQKVLIYQYCSICVPYEPTFLILWFAFFVKNLKIEYDPHFWGGENYSKIQESSLFKNPVGRKFQRNCSISHS